VEKHLNWDAIKLEVVEGEIGYRQKVIGEYPLKI